MSRHASPLLASRAGLLALVFTQYATAQETSFAPNAPPSAMQPPVSEQMAHFRLAVQSEAAWGIGGGRFYNQLVGARLHYQATDAISVGGSLAYANMKGAEGRAHNVLPCVEAEFRWTFGPWAIPLRLGSGYLPNNGPVLRGSLGVRLRVGHDFELGLDLLTPIIWVVGNRTVFSTGGAIEAAEAW